MRDAEETPWGAEEVSCRTVSRRWTFQAKVPYPDENLKSRKSGTDGATPAW